MITVHHLNNSRSFRILWFLEELGIDYEIKYYQRDPKTQLAPPELKQIHPLGKSPVITDGDLVLAESAAILEYLAFTYSAKKWMPQLGTKQGLRCNYWMHYAEGSLMPPLLLKYIFIRIEESPFPFFIRPIIKKICSKVNAGFINPQLQNHRHYVETELSQYPYFAGEEFTIADIQMSYPIETFKSRIGLDDSFMHILDWIEQIHARPAYQRALKKTQVTPPKEETSG